ncbi:MAG: UDP-N-acetylmuramate--L-alanine ligase [Candidatus Limnocylindria bacterium]
MRPGERWHVIGMAGSGAAGAALMCHASGAVVDGCDAGGPSPYSVPLESAGVRLLVGHDPAHLAGVDRVAISPAIRAQGGNAELAVAEQAGIPIATWQALLGELMHDRLGLAVTGTHGKSTTTALLGHLLAHAGFDPAVAVGAYVPAWGASVRIGGGTPFVVEADEFGDNFLHYRAAAAIITNVEMDHPDFFRDEAAVYSSFTRFVEGLLADERLPGSPVLVAAADDPGIDAVLARVPGWAGRVIRYAGRERSGADVSPSRVEYSSGGSRFRVFERMFETTLAGEHNVSNCVAALTVARELGASLDDLVAGLATFAGAGRRMELIGEPAGVAIYDDYAHHPTEVRATIAAARQRLGARRLWAVFEPHMFSRTALFLDAFGQAFAGADEVVIADIFASRDVDTTVTSAEELAGVVERSSGIPTIATGDADATAAYVADHVRQGDAVLVMGAGVSYRIARGIAAHLESGVRA